MRLLDERAFVSEPVADSPHGLDPIERRAEFFAQRCDMDVDIAIYNESIVVIDVVEQLVAGQYFAAVGDEAPQDAEFRKSQRDQFILLA